MGKQLTLNSLIGLGRIRANVDMQIKACRRGGMLFPHTLLTGIGGTGKTALARVISHELGYHLIEVHGAAFTNAKDLKAAIVNYSKMAFRTGRPLLLFIEEVHQLKRGLQEVLYPVMDEFQVSTINGYQKIPPFTFIGATTRPDLLDANSFISRCRNRWEIPRYSVTDIACIVAQNFRDMGLKFTGDVSKEIAKRCLGIPRNAVTLAEKLRMSVLAIGGSEVTMAHVQHVFTLESLDHLGLTPLHLSYMKILGEKKSLGVGAIAAMMRRSEQEVEGSIEPILFELRFVLPTIKGRTITERGAKYLGKMVDKSA